MKRLIIVYWIMSCWCSAYAQNNKIDKSIMDNPNVVGAIEAPFAYRELIEICKVDTSKLSKIFNPEFHDRTPQTMFVKNFLIDILKDSLSNTSYYAYMDTMLKRVEMEKTIDISIDNWSSIYRTCDKCPFCMDVEDIPFYFKFVIVYMTEKDVKQLIDFENGYHWNEMLKEIRYGDVIFKDRTTEKRIVIDTRIIKYLIQKWSPCQIPEVQQLVSVLKEVLPMEYKDEWYEAITGKWRGKFGEKTIEITIDANEFEINGFSKFEGQPDEKRITFYGDEYQQVEGPYVCFTVTEQPTDKEWNGKFNCRLVRNTGKMEGTWTSNNGKLEREFVLDKVVE